MATTMMTNLSPQEQQAQLWDQLVSHNNNKGKEEGKEKGTTPATGCPHNHNCKPGAREWPSYDAVISHVATADYKQNISCPHDSIQNKSKLICPHGAICCVKMELFDFPSAAANNNLKDDSVKPYSGLLTPGATHDHCILRMSTAIRPLDQGIQAPWARAIMKTTVGHKLRKAKLVPGAALKVFRNNGIPSGNLLLLGSKVGQREEDYFAHCQCTQMTEKMPSVALPFVKKFWQYSQYPLCLGLSDFCGHDSGGKSAGAELNFPYSVVWKPLITGADYKTTNQEEEQQPQPEQSESTTTNKSNKLFGIKKEKDNEKNFQTFDSFLDEVMHVPVGTPLFDIYAVPDPKAVGDPTRIERIGRITTTSPIIQSSPTDGISFRHQIKEEDFLFRPDWIKQEETSAKKKIRINDNNTTINRKIMHGKLKGTVGKLAGWRLYEEDIALNQYVDYEKLSSSSSS